MTYFRANYTKGQLQIQQMAFVLVALVIFFAMVALVYFSMRTSDLKNEALALREKEAAELAFAFSSSSEFSWAAAGCSQCVDFDKVLMLKEKKDYKNFWNLAYLSVEKIYPAGELIECTRANYPNCTTITIINKTGFYGSPKGAFVSICRQESARESYVKCEIGKIYATEVPV